MEDARGMVTVSLRRGVQQYQVDITAVSRGGAVGELESVHAKRMALEYARQMPALVQVLDLHALAAERQLRRQVATRSWSAPRRPSGAAPPGLSGGRSARGDGIAVPPACSS
jgi:hypothetical protein